MIKITKHILLFLSILLLPACMFSDDELEEVTLNLFSIGGGKDLIDRLKRQFPHITFNLYNLSANNEDALDWAYSYKELEERGAIPDIILDGAERLVPQFVREGFVFDHSSLIRSAHIVVSEFQPELLDHIVAWSPEGELYALPYTSRLHALYYDKDKMEQGQIPELWDGMTWEDIIDVSAHSNIVMGHNDGLLYALWQSVESQFRLRHVHPETYEADLDHTYWKEALQHSTWVNHPWSMYVESSGKFERSR